MLCAHLLRANRWCLCALKNLTYPLKHPSSVAEEVLKCEILPILIKFVTVSGREIPATKDSSQTVEVSYNS